MNLRTAFNVMERHAMAFDNELAGAWDVLESALRKANMIPRLVAGDRVWYDGIAEALCGCKGTIVSAPELAAVITVQFDGYPDAHLVEPEGVHLSC